MSNKIIVIGSKGQVGKALINILKTDAIALDRTILDLSNLDSIKQTLNNYQAKAVINAAAYTKVDQAEDEAELASIINAQAVKIISQYCHERSIPLIHYSTDYVFAGDNNQPYTEFDQVQPLSIYGKTKLAGEFHVIDQVANYLIFRTSWVYDEVGKNFLTTMLNLGSKLSELNVVANQFGAPTYAKHLAEATITALNNALKFDKFPSGIYHLTNQGEVSWYGFAKEIFRLAKQCSLPITLNHLNKIDAIDYPTRATRPLNSRLNSQKIKNILSVSLPNWQVGLTDCFSKLNLKGRDNSED